MEQTNLLPLGSVVYMKEGIMPLLIVARQPILKMQEEIYYLDYAAVNQLTGLNNIEEIAYFNNEDIREILYQGYISKNEKTVLTALEEWKQNNLDIPKGKVIDLKHTSKKKEYGDLGKKSLLEGETFGF
ncbi:DUF4176 domain-containing protein [Enterococcus mundtii]|uniref:DUF4176 domain-containing protein n=1 Tax=Enterococcus mundtii TaxID=53346 RepID=A0A2T5DB94_ENTMU|nr:DUF4176 domain-containing protein [Enterococcus mundtii]PTO34922.1 hypothetical protein C6N14_10055 [Enterococcus mundtii]